MHYVLYSLVYEFYGIEGIENTAILDFLLYAPLNP